MACKLNPQRLPNCQKKIHILPRNKFKELMSFWQIYYKSVQNILEFHLLSMIFPRQFLEQNVQVGHCQFIQ